MPRCFAEGFSAGSGCHRPLASSAQAQVLWVTVRITDTDDLQLALSEFPVALVRARIDCRRSMLIEAGLQFRNAVRRGFGRK